MYSRKHDNQYIINLRKNTSNLSKQISYKFLLFYYNIINYTYILKNYLNNSFLTYSYSKTTFTNTITHQFIYKKLLPTHIFIKKYFKNIIKILT